MPPTLLYDGTFAGPTSAGAAGTTTGAADVTTAGVAGRLTDRYGGSFSVNGANHLVAVPGAGGYTQTLLDFDDAVSAGATRTIYTLPADPSRGNVWLVVTRVKSTNAFTLLGFNGTMFAQDVSGGTSGYLFGPDNPNAFASASMSFAPTDALVVTVDEYREGPGGKLVVTAHDATTATDYGPAVVTFFTGTPCLAPRTVALGAANEQQFSRIQVYSIPNPNVEVICIGDSRTSGSEVAGQGTATGETYPGVMLSTLGSGFDAYNRGVGGQQVGDGAGAGTGMLATAPTAYYPLLDTARPANVAVVWGGVNDGPRDAAAIYGNLVALCQGLRTAGFKVVICTEISAGGYDATKDAINASVRAGWANFADALADFGGTALGADGASANATYFFSDQIHPTAAGYAVLGPVAAAAVLAALATPRPRRRVRMSPLCGSLGPI